ncbi:MAG TPA: hypothetical protein VJU52_05285 [Flavobacterium sp.]|nr:hypothetical protein [Flavobacterium sp.]
MGINEITKNGFAFFLMLWISVNYAQERKAWKQTNSAAVKKTSQERIASIEKACQTIIDQKYENDATDSLAVAERSISSSDLNTLQVLGDLTAIIQHPATSQTKTQLDTIQQLNTIYSKDKYAGLILRNNEFIKKASSLSAMLHKKADGFDAALNLNKQEELRIVLKKMGEAFHIMGARLDSSIMDFKQTLPYLDETYSQILAIENEAGVTAKSSSPTSERSNEQLALFKKFSSSIALAKSLNGVVLHLASIKKSIAVVSKTQDDLAFLAQVSRSL